VVNSHNKYDTHLADWCAKDDYLSKRNLDKISTYKPLKHFVYKGLLSEWTRKQISVRVKERYPNNSIISISYEAIYKHIYTRSQASLNKKLIKTISVQKNKMKTSYKKTWYW